MGKKVFSLALAAVMAASLTAIPVSAESVNPETSIDNASTIQPRTSTWVVKEDWVRMRREPSLSGEILMLLMKGEYVYESTEKHHVEADGYTWILVSCNRTGWSGYVASEYMECHSYDFG